MSQRPVPPRGMRDLLPEEVRRRRHLLERLLSVYERYGFEQIETPAVEEIGRLLGSEGGDNEKLIYKVLKRGRDFSQQVENESDIVDLGLRYDLTVPLARFFATHSAELLAPFRAIQTGPVWRAERPQKGRYRQFVQCDIDVLGDASTDAEIELVCATAEALRAVDVGDFTIRINDRRLLQALVTNSGFELDQAPNVLIVVDKLDKIGIDGVGSELADINTTAAQALTATLGRLAGATSPEAIAEAMGSDVPTNAIDDLRAIIDGVQAVLADVPVKVDATLVRGQAYYTGSIFEVEHNELRGSLAGGGRYDRMIGKLSGVDVPAVGFSIGFERLFDIVSGRDELLGIQQRIALLYATDDAFKDVVVAAQHLRNQGNVVRPERAAKNRTNQLARLQASGFTHWAEVRDTSHSEVQSLGKEGNS